MPHIGRRSRTGPADTDPLVLAMRALFLLELVKLKPKILSDLRRILVTFGSLRQYLVQRVSGQSVQGRYGWFSAAFPASGDADALRNELITWARTYGIDQPWVLDTALNTLDLWHRAAPEHEELRKRLWPPPAVAVNRAEAISAFVYRSPIVYVDGMDPLEYAEWLRADTDRAIKEHLTDVAAATYVIPDALRRDLRWLAEKITGRTEEEIAGHDAATPNNVSRSISRISKLIGFPSRRGRPRKT